MGWGKINRPAQLDPDPATEHAKECDKENSDTQVSWGGGGAR